MEISKPITLVINNINNYFKMNIQEIKDKIKKGDWVESETAPEETIPYPIWLYHDHIKVYIPQEDCWKTVKNLDVKDLDLQKLRLTQNETLRTSKIR